MEAVRTKILLCNKLSRNQATQATARSIEELFKDHLRENRNKRNYIRSRNQDAA